MLCVWKGFFSDYGFISGSAACNLCQCILHTASECSLLLTVAECRLRIHSDGGRHTGVQRKWNAETQDMHKINYQDTH